MERKQSPLRIRLLKSHVEFDRLLVIQKEVWRHDDIDLTPTHQFCITSRMGAILLGAFVGEELAGFVYSFPTVFRKKLCQHSHLLAVRPRYQGLGIGKKLKWAQRRRALELGYDLITWTFDPLVARNANLNLHTLGAIARTYWPNFYGMTSSLTHGRNIPTDRFLVEWPIRTARVEGRRRERFDTYDESSLPRALERDVSRTDFWPEKPRLACRDRVILVEIPRDVNGQELTTAGVASWQRSLRRVMERYFRRGYAAVDFLYRDRCFYVLKKLA